MQLKSTTETDLIEEMKQLTDEEIDAFLKEAMRAKGYTTFIDHDGVEKPL